jgi:hypothetical protein
VLERQVLAAVVPADVHQLDGVERAAAAPRRAGGMRGLPFERVLDRDEAGAGARTPGDAEVVADVGEQRDVHVLEVPGADEVRLGGDQLLGRAGPQPIVPGSFSRSMIFFTRSPP